MRTAAMTNEIQGNGQVLQSVKVDALMRGLLSEVTVSQIYLNTEQENIEAVYTIPLPADAVLLELKVRLNDEEMTGIVKPRSQANEEYEDAIVDGDTAILLEYAGDGLYTVNVGNLLPGETATVTFRYAQLHRWQGEKLRFFLPTTVAPRYGDPYAAGLQAHQVPEVSLTADNAYSFQLSVEGELSDLDFECPSHPIAVSEADDRRIFTLSGGQSFMDRDFVLLFKQHRESLNPASVLIGQDLEGFVGLASFHLNNEFPVTKVTSCIKLVVDCSGSMGGDSIDQARTAVAEILKQLDPNDYFNITLFGSSNRLLFKIPREASADNLEIAKYFVEKLDADLGGTEIESALQATINAKSPVDDNNILLITDGEVYDQANITKSVKGKGHRVFTIGVGSSVSEKFVRQLSELTGGACELVSPRENMAERIVDQFFRMKQPKVTDVMVQWPMPTRRTLFTQRESFFLNDTIHVFGWFDELSEGEVELSFSSGKQETKQRVMMNLDQDKASLEKDQVARLAAWERLKTIDEEQATQIAVDYQLVTDNTSCVLTKVRAEDEKANSIPALRKVSHMLSAGWGGTGSVYESSFDYDVCYSMDVGAFDDDFDRTKSVSNSNNIRFSKKSVDHDMEFLDIPAFLRRGENLAPFESKIEMELSEYDQELLDIPTFMRKIHIDQMENGIEGDNSDSYGQMIDVLNQLHTDRNSGKLQITTVDQLNKSGLSDDICDNILDFVDDGDIEEYVAVIIFLMTLLESEYGEQMDRNLQRIIRKAFRNLSDEIQETFKQASIVGF